MVSCGMVGQLGLRSRLAVPGRNAIPKRDRARVRLSADQLACALKYHGRDRGARFYRLDASKFPHSNQPIHPVVRYLMSDQSTIRSSMASSMSVEARRGPIGIANGEGTA